MRAPPIPRDGETAAPASETEITGTGTEASQDRDLLIETLAVPAAEASETPSVSETLLESVSSEAILSAAEANDVDRPGEETLAAADPAVDAPPPSSDVPADEDFSKTVPSQAPPHVEPASTQVAETSAAETETVQAPLPADAPPGSFEVPASLLPAEFETAIAAAAPVAPDSNRIIVDMALTEIRAANDTVVAYVQNESIATVAHWRALATARTPADAIRLHVTELQRAADASLNCIVSLTRRAGRIAATVHRT